MADETNENKTAKPVTSEAITANAVTEAKLEANEIRFETITPGDTGAADPAVAPSWLIPDKVYDVLKWVGLIALPAIAVCVQTIGTAAGWSGTDLTVTILTALGTLVGALIGASALKARHTTQE
ncbi:phage holin [Bifidobacterium phasiani]|uniref:phage holin n=1 Tax=Bifidobacterium phasiani TaxID=2834431 RepID=UPI001F2399D7|nr:phage holin [Bifidobacterium phasiani]